MQVLTQGLEPKERVELLFKLTKVKSENIQNALIDHLCQGLSGDNAAILNDVQRQNFNRALKRLNTIAEIVEKIKDIDWTK